VFATGSILDQFAAALAFMATAMVLGGFLAHAGPALDRAAEADLRRATAKGGLFGFGVGFAVVVLSALFDTLIA
jgi:hypothetical protein